MSSISNSIYLYYRSVFESLPLDKKLHFASRLWLWNEDPASRELLNAIRPLISAKKPVELLQSIADGSFVPIGKGSTNAVALRAPYTQHYPNLRGIAATLYWAALLDELYDIDLCSHITEVLDLSELATLYDELLRDDEALAMLSTHAVNFLYLYKYYVLQDTTGPDPNHFLQLVEDGQYDLTDRVQIQLAIYLLTHSIVGESRFYAQAIPAALVPAYTKSIKAVEQLIHNDFAAVNLDNKFEFLVCCKLVGYSSDLESAILDEAADSMSATGKYLVDTHNANAVSTYKTAEKSEHRNALYLIATSQPRLALQAA